MSKKIQYEFFRDFFLVEQAEEIVKLLVEADIPYKLEKSETIIDEAIVGNSLTPKIILRLPKEYFQQANEMIRQNIDLSEGEIELHYLNQMDTEELVEILQKTDEWSIEDAFAAQQILNNRGINYSEEEVKAMQENRLREIRKGKKEPISKILMSFLTILIISIFFSAYFVLAGLGVALYFWKDTTVDTTGFKFFSFDAETRKIGEVSFWIWLMITPLLYLGLPFIWVWLGDVFSFSG